MSAEFRTVEEYTELFAKTYHKTEEQSEKCITVSLFKNYAEEREKHEQERCR